MLSMVVVVVCLLKFNVSFRHCYGHIGDRMLSMVFVCWSLTSLCHSNGHIETMPAREINPFTALTRIRSQFIRTQLSTSNHSEWTRLRLRPLTHWGSLTLLWAERRHPFCAGPLPPPERLTLLSAEWRHPFCAGPLPPPEWLSLLWPENHTVSRTPCYPTKADCHRDVLQKMAIIQQWTQWSQPCHAVDALRKEGNKGHQAIQKMSIPPVWEQILFPGGPTSSAYTQLSQRKCWPQAWPGSCTFCRCPRGPSCCPQGSNLEGVGHLEPVLLMAERWWWFQKERQRCVSVCQASGGDFWPGRGGGCKGSSWFFDTNQRKISGSCQSRQEENRVNHQKLLDRVDKVCVFWHGHQTLRVQTKGTWLQSLCRWLEVFPEKRYCRTQHH